MKIELDSSELKLAISSWLTSQGYAVSGSTPMAITADGVVTVDLGSATAHPVATLTELDPGAPYSLKCIATCFGYKDPGDNGKGAWGANTNNTTIVGVAVPIPILTATLGGLDVSNIKGHTVSVICPQTGKVAKNVDIVDDGPGESVDGKHGLIVGKDGSLHALDMTYGLCQMLGVKYDATSASYPVSWWLNDVSGKPMEMKGLDAPKVTAE